MNLARRKAHRLIWLILAVALPLLLALALRARHPRIAEPLPAALAGEKP